MTKTDKDLSDRHYGELADCVEMDSDRTLAEKETQFGWTRDSDRMTVYSGEASVVAKLLLHPDFELDWYQTSHPEQHGQRIDAETYEEEGHDQRKPVYGVRGTLPIAVLKVKMSPRSRQSHADVVTSGVFDAEDR